MTLIFKNLPLVSLNAWYSGRHWIERSRMKITYKYFVYSVCKKKFTEPVKVEYYFEFKGRAYDPSNCVAMVKLIEDVLFPRDSYKIIRGLYIESTHVKNSKEDKLTMIIKPV